MLGLSPENSGAAVVLEAVFLLRFFLVLFGDGDLTLALEMKRCDTRSIDKRHIWNDNLAFVHSFSNKQQENQDHRTVRTLHMF
jgi:hypothetical protein